jgi:tetratricopeptide (TPR) repeat protein
VTSALLNKAAALLQLGHREDSLAMYDDAFARLDDSKSDQFTDAVTEGLLNRASILRELGRFDDSVATSDRVISLVAAGAEPAAQEHSTVALINKGAALSACSAGRTPSMFTTRSTTA